MSTENIENEYEDEDLSTENTTEKSETDSDETGEDGPDRVAGLFLTASEDCQEEDRETDYLVENLVPKDSMVLLSARAKAGKTTYLLHLSKSVVEGTDFLGREVEQSDVLYLTEQPLSSFKSEYLFECGLEDSEHLHYASEGDTVGADLEEVMKRVADAAQKTGAELVVIDTFLSFSGLEDEEENSSGPVKTALQTIRNYCSMEDLTVILAHHDRKSGGSVIEASRGSSVITGEPDVIFGLRTDPDRDNARRIESEGRFSDIPEYQRIALQDGSYKMLGSSAPGLNDVTKMIRKLLPPSKDEALKKKEVMEILEEKGEEPSESTVGRNLKYLVEDHDSIERFRGEGRGNPYKYFRDVDSLFAPHDEEGSQSEKEPPDEGDPDDEDAPDGEEEPENEVEPEGEGEPDDEGESDDEDDPHDGEEV